MHSFIHKVWYIMFSYFFQIVMILQILPEILLKKLLFTCLYIKTSKPLIASKEKHETKIIIYSVFISRKMNDFENIS